MYKLCMQIKNQTITMPCQISLKATHCLLLRFIVNKNFALVSAILVSLRDVVRCDINTQNTCNVLWEFLGFTDCSVHSVTDNGTVVSVSKIQSLYYFDV